MVFIATEGKRGGTAAPRLEYRFNRHERQLAELAPQLASLGIHSALHRPSKRLAAKSPAFTPTKHQEHAAHSVQHAEDRYTSLSLPMLSRSRSTTILDWTVSGDRHFGLPSHAKDSLTSPSGRRIADIELELIERLHSVESPTAIPSRHRAKAALDALHELSQLPTPLSPILSCLCNELKTATIALRTRGGRMPHGSLAAQELPRTYAQAATQLPESFFFELVDGASFRQGMEVSPPGDLAEQQRVRQEAERAKLLNEIDELQGKVDQSQQQVERLKRRETERSNVSGKAAQDYQLLVEERDALWDKIVKLENALQAKAENLKEAQVELFIERKRSHEQSLLYKEMRDKKREGDTAAAQELAHWQRAVLRAHHAHLEATEAQRVLAEICRLSREQQLSRAVYWANGLPAVDIEGELLLENGDEAAKPAAITKLKVATKVISSNAASTNDFFKALSTSKEQTGN